MLPLDDAKTSPSEVAIVNESREYFPASAMRHCWRFWQFSRRSLSGAVAVAVAGRCFWTGLDIGTGVAIGMGFADGW